MVNLRLSLFGAKFGMRERQFGHEMTLNLNHEDSLKWEME